MNVLYKPLGGEYVFKTFPRISIPDRGKVVLDFQNFDPRQKSAAVFYLFRNPGERLLDGVEICPTLYLETEVFLTRFIALVYMWHFAFRHRIFLWTREVGRVDEPCQRRTVLEENAE